MGADSGHHYCSCAGHGGEGRRDAAADKIFRPAGDGRKLGSSDFCVFRPFQADPYLISTILDLLNSFSWSLFADSSPFERYDKNKVGRLLDRVFRPPQQPLDQGEGIDVFLVSWAFH